jgi:hypothetical protein
MDLKEEVPIPPLSSTTNKYTAPYTAAQVQEAERLLNLIDQIEKAVANEDKGKDKSSAKLVAIIPPEAAYYEGLLEDYFENDCPAILEEFGVSELGA